MSRPPAPGTNCVPMVSPGWRVVTQPKRCRAGAGPGRKACGEPAVAEVSRGRYSRSGRPSANWWAYCARDMYGHWIEDGQVMNWRYVPLNREDAQ